MIVDGRSEFLIMSTRSISVNSLRPDRDRRMSARRKEDYWLLATACALSVIVSFIAMVTLV
jgi:hypothetical protein